MQKRLLLPDRRRQPPAEGFSWIDRRFVQEVAPRLSRDAILLYFLLAAVSDKDGLSYWGDPAISSRLRIDLGTLRSARDELVARRLIAYEAPLYQVLSLPREDDAPRRLARPFSLGEILRGGGSKPASAGRSDVP